MILRAVGNSAKDASLIGSFSSCIGQASLVLGAVFSASAAFAAPAKPYVSVKVANAPVERASIDSGASLSTRVDRFGDVPEQQFKVSGMLDVLMLNYTADQNSIRKGEQLTMAGLRYRPTVSFQMAPWLRSQASAKLWMTQGYAESRLGTWVPPQSFVLYEAWSEATPVDFLAIRVGAINQADMDNEVLIGDSSFPGVAEKFTFGGDLLSAEIRAQQTVPTSTTLSTNAVDVEPMPTFFTESIYLKTNPVPQFEARVYGTHFRFNDLGTVVAASGEFRGNTVNEAGPNSTRFRYQFEGAVLGGGGRVDLSRKVALVADYQYLQNFLAPETRNRGQAAYLQFQVRVPGEITLKPRGDIFFMEADAAPAYWLESFYGAQTNRTGWAAELGADFGRQKFSTIARFMSFEPLTRNSYQSAEQLFFVGFRSRHDLL